MLMRAVILYSRIMSPAEMRSVNSAGNKSRRNGIRRGNLLQPKRRVMRSRSYFSERAPWDLSRGAVVKKVWERTQKTSHFQQHFKLIFKSIFNEVFTFNALQTKTLKCGNAFRTTTPLQLGMIIAI